MKVKISKAANKIYDKYFDIDLDCLIKKQCPLAEQCAADDKEDMEKYIQDLNEKAKEVMFHDPNV